MSCDRTGQGMSPFFKVKELGSKLTYSVNGLLCRTCCGTIVLKPAHVIIPGKILKSTIKKITYHYTITLIVYRFSTTSNVFERTNYSSCWYSPPNDYILWMQLFLMLLFWIVMRPVSSRWEWASSLKIILSGLASFQKKFIIVSQKAFLCG